MDITVFRARFDGKVIIPEEPIQLPVGKSFEFRVQPPEVNFASEPAATLEQRQAALQNLLARAQANAALPIPEHALHREYIYERQDGE